MTENIESIYVKPKEGVGPRISPQKVQIEEPPDHIWTSKATKTTVNHNNTARRQILTNKKFAKTLIRLSNHEILFPFAQPYPCQLAIMDAVLQGIVCKQNALIESPTGTGKTLSVLCAAVSALQKLRSEQKEDSEEPPVKIIFCTRTHSQIEQIFNEIKTKLPYILRISPFASRAQTCIFEDLPQRYPGNALNLSCSLLRKLKSVQSQMTSESKIVLKIRESKDPNKDLNQTRDIEDTPMTIVKTGCPFYHGYQKDSEKDHELKSFFDVPWEQPLSVSDYVKLGQIHSHCPYYLMKGRVGQCDLAIIPYNYVLDKDLRSQVGLDLTNSVVIFDEGHNIEAQCEDLFAFELTVNDLFCSYQVLNQIWKELQAEEEYLSEYARYQVKGQRIDTKACCIFVIKIIDVLESYNVERKDNKIFNQNFPGHVHVFKLPELFSIFAMVFGKLKDEKDFMMERMRSKSWTYGDGDNCKLNEPDSVIDQAAEVSFSDKIGMFVAILEKCIAESGDKAKILNKLYDVLVKTNIAFEHYQETLGDDLEDDTKAFYDFYVCIQDEPSGPPGPNGEIKVVANRRKLGVWCFNPSFSFKMLQKDQQPRSIIFTSGTLAPLSSYPSELDTPFPIQIENDHVINKNKQVLVGVVTQDFEGKTMNFSYKSRDDANAMLQFGKTLQRIFLQIQSGVLIFLPSYTVLNKIKKCWKSNKILREMQKERDIFLEETNQSKNKHMLDDYLATINQKGKAAFFAVCRGKLSEGIDFSDEAARCVIMAGIPYPQVYDPKVLIKKDYLDKKFKANPHHSQLNGQGWYRLQAQRAINQAIGRVIRHINDYGVILLMDERYRSSNIQISQWIDNVKRLYCNFTDLEADLEAFFRLNGGKEKLTEATVDSNGYKQARNEKFKNKRKILNKKASKAAEKDTKPQSAVIQYEFSDQNGPEDALSVKLDSAFQQRMTASSSGALFHSSKYCAQNEEEFFAEKLDFNDDQTAPTTPQEGLSKLVDDFKYNAEGGTQLTQQSQVPVVKQYKRKPYKRTKQGNLSVTMFKKESNETINEEDL